MPRLISDPRMNARMTSSAVVRASRRLLPARTMINPIRYIIRLRPMTWPADRGCSGRSPPKSASRISERVGMNVPPIPTDFRRSHHFSDFVLQNGADDPGPIRCAPRQRFGELQRLFERGPGGHRGLERIDEGFHNDRSRCRQRLFEDFAALRGFGDGEPRPSTGPCESCKVDWFQIAPELGVAE